jgi:hypothetical protein
MSRLLVAISVGLGFVGGFITLGGLAALQSGAATRHSSLLPAETCVPEGAPVQYCALFLLQIRPMMSSPRPSRKCTHVIAVGIQECMHGCLSTANAGTPVADQKRITSTAYPNGMQVPLCLVRVVPR